MTREEAITRIKDHIEIHRYHERNAVKIFEALDMAIKALEQEPCEDAVSRDSVKFLLCKEICHPGAFCPDGFCREICEKVDALPSAGWKHGCRSQSRTERMVDHE